MKSPDTTLGKWALHSRWVKQDLKNPNRSGLPGNAAQQPPAQTSTLSLFLHPPLCSRSTFVGITVGTLSWGTGAGLEHQRWDLPPLVPCRGGEHDVKSPTLLQAVGSEARAMSLGNDSSQNYHPARNWEAHWAMGRTANTTLPHALAGQIVLVLLNATSWKHLGSQSKITSSDNSPPNQGRQ